MDKQLRRSFKRNRHRITLFIKRFKRSIKANLDLKRQNKEYEKNSFKKRIKI